MGQETEAIAELRKRLMFLRLEVEPSIANDISEAAEKIITIALDANEITPAVEKVLRERIRQVEIGYTPEHDDQHSFSDWLRFIQDRAEYQRYGLRFPERYAQGNEPYANNYEACLVKIAAFAVAAIESFDRRAEASADFVEANPDALESIRQKFAQKLSAQKPGHPWLTGEGAFAKYAPETSAVGADNKTTPPPILATTTQQSQEANLDVLLGVNTVEASHDIHHKQVPVRVTIDIDEGVAELVMYLGSLPGVRTHASCQGTVGEGGPKPYGPYVLVSWSDAAALERLQTEFDVSGLSGEGDTDLSNSWGEVRPRTSGVWHIPPTQADLAKEVLA